MKKAFEHLKVLKDQKQVLKDQKGFYDTAVNQGKAKEILNTGQKVYKWSQQLDSWLKGFASLEESFVSEFQKERAAVQRGIGVKKRIPPPEKDWGEAKGPGSKPLKPPPRKHVKNNDVE